MGLYWGIMRLSLTNLYVNKLRSFLTVLGIIFGTAAVMATLTSNEGASQYIQTELRKLGTNVVTVQSRGAKINEDHIHLVRKYTSVFSKLTLISYGTGSVSLDGNRIETMSWRGARRRNKLNFG